MAGGLGYGERRRRLSVRAKNEEGEGKMARGERGGGSARPRPRLLARGWEEGGVDTAKQEVAGARLRASATRPSSWQRRKTTGEGARWAGPATWAARWLPLLSNVSVFYFLQLFLLY